MEKYLGLERERERERERRESEERKRKRERDKGDVVRLMIMPEMFVVVAGDYADVGVLTAGRTAKGKGRSCAGEESRSKRGGTSKAQPVEEEKFAKSMVEKAAWTSRWSMRGRCEATGSTIGILPSPTEFDKTTSNSSTALRDAMLDALGSFGSLESWLLTSSSSSTILLS